MVDIDKQCSHYIVQCIALFILLNFLASVAMHYHYVGNIVLPVLVSSLFVLVLEVTAALVWRWVAKNTVICCLRSSRLFLASVSWEH